MLYPDINIFLKPFDVKDSKKKVYIEYVPVDKVGEIDGVPYTERVENLVKLKIKHQCGYDLPVEVTVCRVSEPGMLAAVTVVDIPDEILDKVLKYYN